jgi:uncharacterized protein YecE (DUF72 family)
MELNIGTSGFGYKAWRGRFYPEDLSPDDFLRYYATRFAVVEINNTYYRMPQTAVLEKWRAQVPTSFRFAFKASRRITHFSRLKDAASSVEFLWQKLEAVGPGLGPILFQLPPQFALDRARLDEFLASLPAGIRAAFEFRHSSWLNAETVQQLAAKNATLVVSETERGGAPPLLPGTPWGYLRLHRFDYAEDDLKRWADQVRAQGWTQAYVFFKHEDEARGPRFAERFGELTAAG